MVLDPAGRTAIISALGGLGVGLFISGWQGTPSIAHEAPERGMHSHDDNEVHSLVHVKESWLTVHRLAKNVSDHLGAVDKNTVAVRKLKTQIEVFAKQCESFEAWKTKQEETNTRLKSNTAGTLAKVGGRPCAEEGESCKARNSDTLNDSAIILNERLARLEETVDNPEWVANLDALGTKIEACDTAFLRADDHIGAMRQTRDALQRAYKPKLRSVSPREAQDAITLTVRFEIGVGTNGEPLCDQYLVFASLDSNSGPVWGKETSTGRATGPDVECEADVRIDGKLTDYYRDADIFIISKQARHIRSLALQE